MALTSLFIVAGLLSCATSAAYTYNTMYFSEPLDHINGDPGFITIKAIFSQGDPAGPLFVYTGDNNPIDQAYNNAGWVTQFLQPNYNASVIFIEHRFYGVSQPGNKNYNLLYLTTTQALLDWADIVQQVRPSSSTPVIAIGGVYGGMMAAFFRIKFPHIVDGAIASSAPFLAPFDLNGSGYARAASNDYAAVNASCASNINFGFNILQSLLERPVQWDTISNVFKTCQPIAEPLQIFQLQDYLTAAFKLIAEYNYPYISNMYGPLPPWAVNVTCGIISKYNQAPINIWTTLQGMYEVANMFYNYTGRLACHDIENTPNHGLPWFYQICTEMVWPEGQYGPPNDIFPLRAWNYTSYAQSCNQLFGVYPRPEWNMINFGMTMNANATLEFDSNFIFSYGSLDPFKTSCFSDLTNFDSLVLPINGVSTATDLRGPSPQDPQSLIYARNREVLMINQWIKNKVSSASKSQ
ncbi:unnamed protein product [Blepharisma stoltei]|uniref:Lysosomal Pro-X carboxypeptidase n=1 Tax=Blepharisma stoltei TaxID=1481888 RepID=A0AAU9K3Q1_9CILI|nr:unnamed protein product [Blepharisma stoltei]